MAVITVENLTHTYSVGTPFEHSVTLTQGESIFVLGHTGSGKSTFVQHLNALLQPTRGQVKIDGEDINKDKISRRDVKRRVGLVFQYPEYQLFEETVAADIAFGPKNMKLPKACPGSGRLRGRGGEPFLPFAAGAFGRPEAQSRHCGCDCHASGSADPG